MLSADDLAGMHCAAQSLSFQLTMRSNAWGLLGFGALNLLAGVFLGVYPGTTSAYGPAYGFAAFLLLAGAATFSARWRAAIIVQGLAETLYGLALASALVLAAVIWQTASIHFFAPALVAIWSVVFGIQRLGDYGMLSPVPTAACDERIRGELADLVRSMTSVDPRKEPDVIAFQTKRFTGSRNWIAGLCPGFAVLVEGRNRIFCAAQSDFRIETIRIGPSSGRTSIALDLAGRSETGEIYDEFLLRYEDWSKDR